MRRKVVQHGPNTLTLSLPTQWVRERGVVKGDEITLEPLNNGLFLTTDKTASLGSKRLNVHGTDIIVNRAVAALYKAGYDEIIIEYENAKQLQAVYKTLNTGCIGLEIVSESKGEIVVRSVSEPAKEGFKTLFRRVFFFLIAMADDGLVAARKHDVETYRELVLRDITINKLTDFCRRIINKRGQDVYACDTCLYHIVEQLERVGDEYKRLNYVLQSRAEPLSPAEITDYENVNALLKEFDEVFFNFDLAKMETFFAHAQDVVLKTEDREIKNCFIEIVKLLADFNGPVMSLLL